MNKLLPCRFTLHLPFLICLHLLSGEAAAADRWVGKLKVHRDALPVPIAVARSTSGQHWEVIISDRAGQVVQTLELRSGPQLDPAGLLTIEDFDGDGYKDLLSVVGHGHSPFPWIELFRFDKKTGQFKMDAEFPIDGSPTPAPKRGCVYIETRAGIYYTTQWCIVPKTGEWNETSRCSSDPSEKRREGTKKCPPWLGNYIFEFWRKPSRMN